MNAPVHVLGFSGSLRKGSYNAALLRAAAELLPEGMALKVFDPVMRAAEKFNAKVD